jgi:hypothetical protein
MEKEEKSRDGGKDNENLLEKKAGREGGRGNEKETSISSEAQQKLPLPPHPFLFGALITCNKSNNA